MMTTDREYIHRLVDSLDDGDLPGIREYLDGFRDDAMDNMHPEDRKALNASIALGRQQIAEGKGISVEDVIARLRARK